jgi:hypothetical protein
MKVTAIGIAHRCGKASKTGKEFDFATLYVLEPIEIRASESFTQTGFGFQPSEVSVQDYATVQKFAKAQFPAIIELELGHVSRFGKLETVVTGLIGLPQPLKV